MSRRPVASASETPQVAPAAEHPLEQLAVHVSASAASSAERRYVARSLRAFARVLTAPDLGVIIDGGVPVPSLT